ncbi:MAG: HNH endonuclease [Bdellovibrionales bacterium]
MLLWLSEKVEVLEFHTALTVRSATQSFQLPAVIRLNRYIHKKYVNRVRFCRENIYLRDKYNCQYCGEEFSYRSLTLDHVVPLSRGGHHNWENVVTACGPCNNKKADKTPKEARMPLRSRPKEPKFLPNVQFSRKFHQYPDEWVPYLPKILAGT